SFQCRARPLGGGRPILLDQTRVAADRQIEIGIISSKEIEFFYVRLSSRHGAGTVAGVIEKIINRETIPVSEKADPASQGWGYVVGPRVAGDALLCNC